MNVVCPVLTLGSTEDTIYEDKIYSIPSRVNVEVDDGSVPMTTNPSYERIESTSDHRRALNVEVDDGSVPMTTNPSYERIASTSDHRRALYANL